MNIKKIGHCCLVINTQDTTILTDPGTFTTEQNFVTGIDAIVITHEHGDHFHVDSVKEIVKNNPQVRVITNTAVGKLLDEAGVAHEIVENGGTTTVKSVHIVSKDGKHEEIFEELGQVQNTGYMIDTLFYPGDAYIEPGVDVAILALPIAGPWCKLPDAIRYALRVKPKKAFPVHDAVLRAGFSMNAMVEKIFADRDVEFVDMKAGDEKRF